MKKLGFDMQKYLQLSIQEIKNRIDKFGQRLYLEVGGKLFDDMHASRVLPGFEPDEKIQILSKMKQDIEVIMCISTKDIVGKKTRNDNELSYSNEVLRQIQLFENYGLNVSNIVITLFNGEEAALEFKRLLEVRGKNVVLHKKTKGYPTDIDTIVSDEGYGSNPMIEVSKPLVVVTAPGPGSGKLATCLSQLYHENKHGINAGYSKLETFPVYNLELEHPVNIAYEAATLDLGDKNMIDPFHYYAFGQMAINYNRDIEAFPLLRRILQKISGQKILYKSPTEMGLNFVGDSIIDNNIVKNAARNEILRRYMSAKLDFFQGKIDEEMMQKAKQLCDQVAIAEIDRKVVKAARDKANITDCVCAAIEIDKKIICGKTTDELTCASSVILNALKYLANISDNIRLIPNERLKPVFLLKKEIFKDANPRLCLEDCLLALYSNQDNEVVARALNCIKQLENCEFHSTAVLDMRDRVILKKLRINITADPVF